MLKLGTMAFDFAVIINEIIYFILVIIFILDLFIISDIQCQIYLQCKFDYDDLPCRLVPLGGAPELDVDTIVSLSNPSEDPILPLSDVTSISKFVLLNQMYLICDQNIQLHRRRQEIAYSAKYPIKSVVFPKIFIFVRNSLPYRPHPVVLLQIPLCKNVYLVRFSYIRHFYSLQFEYFNMYRSICFITT